MVYQLFTKASSSSREPGVHKRSVPQPACSIAAAWFDSVGRLAALTRLPLCVGLLAPPPQDCVHERILQPQGANSWFCVCP